MVKFKEYKIKELFDIHPTKSYGLTNDKLFSSIGKTPVVVNSSINNGIGGYIDLPPTEKGNIITFSDTTTDNAIFYQPYDFIGYSHVQGVYPLEKEKWTQNSLLYFLTLFKKCAKGRFDYATKFNRTIALDMVISLPIRNNGEIDYKYMEERISELEEERISELERYLKVTGLDNYKLSESEKNTIEKLNSKNFKTQKFKLGEGDNRLFDITTTKKKFNANCIKFGGKYPYVARSSVNNGIRGYITEDEKYLNEANTISFGQDTATIFYQEQPYFTGDKIKIMTFREKALDKNLACYLIATMKRAFQNFSWGQSSFNENILKNIEIELPVIDKNKIDYDFIEKFITAQQKLAIKNIVDWRDKQINATKQIVNNT